VDEVLHPPAYEDGTDTVDEVLHPPAYEDGTNAVFRTSAIRNWMPGNYPKENILHIEHSESLKSRILMF